MRKRGARSWVCGGRDIEDSLCSVCFPLHTSTPGPVLLACVYSRHQGSPQVHTAPGPIKRLKRRGAVFPNAGNYLKSQIACPVPNPGYSETLAADLDSDGNPEARWRTNRVSRAGERAVGSRDLSRSICWLLQGTVSGLFVPNPLLFRRGPDRSSLSRPQLRPGNSAVMNETFKLTLIAKYCS